MRLSAASTRAARTARVARTARAFSSQTLIPNEPLKPNVVTETVPGPKSKAIVSRSFGRLADSAVCRD